MYLFITLLFKREVATNIITLCHNVKLNLTNLNYQWQRYAVQTTSVKKRLNT